MRLINSSQLLHASEPTVTTNETGGTPQSKSPLLNWLPGILLVAAIVTIAALGSSTNPRSELDWLNKMANNGDTGAQLQLGLAYREGRYGLAPDSKTGMYWLKKAASNGNIYAEDQLGTAYARGEGTQKDVAQAEQWWRKAIKGGNRAARIHLANILIQSGQTQAGDQLLM